MYTLESLQQKNLKELKEIGYELNVLPDGDRRCRQNWIDAIAGVNPPLLQLLESSGVETVQEAIEHQALEVAETSPGAQIDPVQEPLESKFGRIVYPQPAVKPIAQTVENSPGVNFDPEEFSQTHAAEIESYFESFTEGDRPPNRGDNGRDRLESEPKVSQSAIALAAKNSPGVNCVYCHSPEYESLRDKGYRCYRCQPETLPGVNCDLNPILTAADRISTAPGIKFSERFLSLYAPPNFSRAHEIESDGQLKLLERVSDPEPPDPDYYITLTEFWAVMNAWNATYTDSVEQFRDFDPQQNNAEFDRTATEREGAGEISIDAPATSGRDICSERDGASIPRHDEGLGSQEGDRILEVARHDSGDSGRAVPRQPAQLNEQQPPGRGDGRGGYVELAIGMLVGRRRDRQHIGKILAIYKTRRGIWRAKIQPLNKSNFVYFDCAALIEQRLLYDYQMKPGGFLPSGQVFDKSRGDKFGVYSRKVRSPKPTNWTPGQLSELSTFKLKQIAREMEIPAIPGRAGKRSLIRAILAEQAISQEKTAAQTEKEASRATVQKQKSAPASKKKRAAASPLGNQLSLFDVAV